MAFALVTNFEITGDEINVVNRPRISLEISLAWLQDLKPPPHVSHRGSKTRILGVSSQAFLGCQHRLFPDFTRSRHPAQLGISKCLPGLRLLSAVGAQLRRS